MKLFFSSTSAIYSFLVTLPIFLMGMPGLQAQEELSLSGAIAKGLNNNFDIRIADQDVNIAQTNNTWGQAGRWPTVSFSFRGSWFLSDNPTAFVPERLNGNLGPNLDWVLFDGFRINASKARLDLLERQSEGNAAIVVETSIQAIILAYYNALLAQEQVAVLQEVLDASRERLDYEALRKDVGTTGTFELLQFKDAVLNDSANLAVQQLNLSNAFKNLNRIMGADLSQDYTLTDELQTEFRRYELEDLLEKMTDNNNNLRNQFITNQILRQDIRIAKSALYPTLSVNAGVNLGFGSARLISGENRTFNAYDYTAGFSISFNLFNGGIARRALQTAKVTELVGEIQQEDLEQQLTLDMMVAYDSYQTRLEILAIRLASIENAQLNLEMAEERFTSGLISSIEYRVIQLQYLNARLAHLQALRDLKESETELIRLTGGLVRDEN